MKKALIILLTTILIAVVFNFSFSTYYCVCVDPGHGGSDSGTRGKVYGVLEKNANLTIALALKNKIEYYWVESVLMTRATDVTVSLYNRAIMANTANDGSGVNYFISVHHNADSTDTSKNGTEVYYCNAESTDWFGGLYRGPDWMYRARDSTFAKKVRLTLRDSLHYIYRCCPDHYQCGGSVPCCMNCYAVLKNTTMASVLSEASFLTNPAVEYKFYSNNADYINKEAGALCKGWWSTYQMGGVATVKNAYWANGGTQHNGYVQIEFDTLSSPVEACWLIGESHNLNAVSPQIINGYWYTFHHWTHFLPWGVPWDYSYYPFWIIQVPSEFDFHLYVAYFKGGPYYVTYSYGSPGSSPYGYSFIGDSLLINFSGTSLGVDTTAKVSAFLDRNGGGSGIPRYFLQIFQLNHSQQITGLLQVLIQQTAKLS